MVINNESKQYTQHFFHWIRLSPPVQWECYPCNPYTRLIFEPKYSVTVIPRHKVSSEDTDQLHLCLSRENQYAAGYSMSEKK